MLQLLVGHCVVALYEAIVTMTDGVCFCQLRSKIRIHNRGSYNEVGAMSITTSEAPDNNNNNHTATHGRSTRAIGSQATYNLVRSDASNNTGSFETGQVTDPDNKRFVLKYTYLGTRINSKEISLAVLDALATIAVYNFGRPCAQLEMLSDRDQVATIVEEYNQGAVRQLTYGDAARALKLMYDKIMIANKSFGDVYLELVWDGKKFGEIRVLKSARDGNTAEAVTDS
ncbi:MAG: hypothetical protein Q9191_001837 [Dirinaria sp. TL-2023a]